MTAIHDSESYGAALKRWLPVILWAGLIFYFSTESFSFANTEEFVSEWVPWLLPGVAPAELTPFQVILRKFGHWFEYFILAILVLRALRRDDEAELGARTLVWTVGGVTAYAVSDELHQMWAPERAASAIDVMIDAFGGVCGVFWFYFRHGKNPGI